MKKPASTLPAAIGGHPHPSTFMTAVVRDVQPHPSTFAIPVAVSMHPAPKTVDILDLVGTGMTVRDEGSPVSTIKHPRDREANLTPKQEAFCAAYIETGNASQAYRESYDAANMSPASVNRAAKELVDNPKIAARVNQMREPVLERMQVTLEGHLSDLLALRERAVAEGKWAPAVQAEIARGKAAGLYVQKSENINVEMSIEDIDFRLAELLAKYKTRP